jgi:hypothetical protein
MQFFAKNDGVAKRHFAIDEDQPGGFVLPEIGSDGLKGAANRIPAAPQVLVGALRILVSSKKPAIRLIFERS